MLLPSSNYLMFRRPWMHVYRRFLCLKKELLMSLKLMGKKIGMTQLFDEKGNRVVCTVLSVEPNVVTQVKTAQKEGYNAVQLGAHKVAEKKRKNISKPLAGHFAKAQVEPRKMLRESKSEDEYQIGQEIGLEYFAETTFVDVIGTSKGKGFQGVIKKHNFGGGPASHGSGFHRSAGSTGMRSTPGRTFPGHKMPGHMGSERVTAEGLKIVKVDAEKCILVIRGAVPGSKGSVVEVRKSLKKEKK